MEVARMKAERRSALGRNQIKKLRTEGWMPAVVYGGEGKESVSIQISEWELDQHVSKRNKVFSLELEERWAGDATPGDVKHREYKRLRRLARAKGWSIGWVVKCYKELFGTAPCLDDVTEDERRDEFSRLLKLARKKGNKPGWAMYLFRETFGSWPVR